MIKKFCVYIFISKIFVFLFYTVTFILCLSILLNFYTIMMYRNVQKLYNSDHKIKVLDCLIFLSHNISIIFYSRKKHTSNSGILWSINRKILGRSSDTSLLSYDDRGAELVRPIIVVDAKIPSNIIVQEERKLITFIWNTSSKRLQVITSRQNIYYGQIWFFS